jgi:hypothetical protein
MTDFKDCAFYSCREDEERISHDSPEAAIEDHLANYVGQPGENNRQTMERIGGTVTVHGFDRDEVSDAWLKSASEGLAERTAEMFGEIYGDPDGGPAADDGFTNDVIAEMATAIQAAIEPVVRDHGKVWNYKRVASRTFTTDEVVGMLGEE